MFNTLTAVCIEITVRRNSGFSKLCIEIKACVVKGLSLRMTLKVPRSSEYYLLKISTKLEVNNDLQK